MSRLKEVQRVLTVIKEALPALSAAGSLVFHTQVSAAPDRGQDLNNNCPAGETPHYVLGFAQLHEVVGNAMGDPLECEHGNPDNQDTLQKTSTGLNFWRASINQVIFTDGFRHWSNNNGDFRYWEGLDIEPPANAEKPPVTLESFISSSVLTGQTDLDKDRKLEIRSSSDSTFTLAINQATRDQLSTLLKTDAIKNNYRRIEVITVSSPAQVPTEWSNQGMSSVNLGYYRGSDVLDFYPIGSFNVARNSDDLILLFAPRPDLQINDPAVVSAVNDTVAQKLFTAAIHNGDLNIANPLLGRNDYLKLASQDVLQINPLVAQN